MRADYIRGGDIATKLFKRSQDNPETGCLEWTAGKDVNGYGRIWYSGKNRTAHTVSYERWIAEIPVGMHVLHQCDNPCCINPEHLVLGTHADNMRHKSERKRIHGKRNPMHRRKK